MIEASCYRSEEVEYLIAFEINVIKNLTYFDQSQFAYQSLCHIER